MIDKMSAKEFLAMQVTKIDTRNPFYKYLTAEDKEHAELLNYCKINYADVIVIHTPSEGKRTPFERYKASLMGLTKGIPDFLFLERRGYSIGLAIELKATGKKIYLKDGKTFVADETIRKQAAMIERLRAKGYVATFAIGIDEAKKIAENYLNNKL